MPDKDADPNTSQILSETTERKALFGRKELPPLPLSESDKAGRFDILPANAIADERDKKAALCRCGKDVCPHCGKPTRQKEKTAITSDNYRHMYLESQREAAAERLQTNDKKQAEKDARAQAEKQKQDEQRYRARDLQDQLSFWRQQIGQGLYDEGTVNGMIAQLESELNAIPPHLW